MNHHSARAACARRVCAHLGLVVVAMCPTAGASAQPVLTLAQAIEAARQSSPVLRAADASVSAARSRERQASSLPNPTLGYGREQTARGALQNAQHIVQLEQPIELGGQRGKRIAVARARRGVAEAARDVTARELDFGVARAYLLAIAADRRARLAALASATYLEAQRVIDERLKAGDASGYAARRLRLEVARAAVARATYELERRTARVALASLMGRVPAAAADSLVLPDSVNAVAVAESSVPLDTLVAGALRRRPELRAAAMSADVTRGEARLVAGDRIPTPAFSAGFKSERVADPALGTLTGFRGIVAGFAMPLPLFDRRAGAMAAADADLARDESQVEDVRRRILQEVASAADAVQAATRQAELLAPHVGAEMQMALRAIQSAYVEGEVTLVEWLDAVRTYHDAEILATTLRTDVLVRRLALALAVGEPMPATLPTDR